MTTTTTAASNGSTDTTTAGATGQPEKPFGMAKVREAETYHTPASCTTPYPKPRSCARRSPAR